MGADNHVKAMDSKIKCKATSLLRKNEKALPLLQKCT
jgi:hypothetical protein